MKGWVALVVRFCVPLLAAQKQSHSRGIVVPKIVAVTRPVTNGQRKSN